MKQEPISRLFFLREKCRILLSEIEAWEREEQDAAHEELKKARMSLCCSCGKHHFEASQTTWKSIEACKECGEQLEWKDNE